MAYCPNKNLLFLHIPKNAGKSVEVGLGLVSKESLGTLGRRSFLNRVFTFLQRKTGSNDSRKKLYGTIDVSLCGQHLTYQELCLLNLLSVSDREKAVKIAVCRNPWNRAVSTFNHFRSSAGSSDLKRQFYKFWREMNEMDSNDHNILAHLRTQSDFILDSRGNSVLNHLLKFENLADDFNELIQKLGFPGKLPHLGNSKSTITYKDYYTEDSKKLIEGIFEEDIERFKYSFN